MASVTLEGVSKRYRHAVAVRDFDLEVHDGEMMVVVGPSGCGKTTVLRLIAGLEDPDEGVVRFDGQDMSGVRPGERNIAMVFEGYALYPHLAVRDNLAFALSLRRTPREEVDRRVSDVAAAMELSHLLERRTPGLATGEAQHVAVGRAVVRETPEVLLLDDALSHLDARQRLEARAEVGRLHRDLGSTVVSVTHDQAEALAIGTRVAVMDDGTLMQVGTPQELYQRPANVFVAGFIGSPAMNLMETILTRHDGRAELRRGPIVLRVPADVRRAGGPTVTVGVRPEDVVLAPPASDDELGLRGRCEVVEFLGPRLLVHLRVGDEELVVFDVADDDIRPGDIVDCSLPLSQLHYFDTASGRRLATEVPAAAL